MTTDATVPALPWAARLQGEVLHADYRLTEWARELRPGVRWWWGERRDETRHGAFCYLCRAFIGTWDTRYPITDGAALAIRTHRDTEHVARALT